jgi:diphthamide biosynthesis methyltransferase
MTNYLRTKATNIAFPELTVLPRCMLERFKQNTRANRHVQAVLDLIRRQEEAVAESRAQIRDKSLKAPERVILQFGMMNTPNKVN